MGDTTSPLLEVRGLRTEFPISSSLGKRKVLKAVDDVSFDVYRGTTLGIVGESGSGKSTLARTIIGLENPAAGSIRFNGVELVGASSAIRRDAVRNIQMVFQDPMASLNPRLTAEQAVSEAWKLHRGVVDPTKRRSKAIDLLERVGLDPDHATRLPHQFSGGQRQRIGIARALALNPQLIICDEAVSALDVSVQAQILNLLGDLQSEFSLTYLFIAHDLSVVRHVSDDVMVMYLGSTMEIGPVDQVFGESSHPYTGALLSAIPEVRPWDAPPRERILLSGDLPSPLNPPPGCQFRTRCWKAAEICETTRPQLLAVPGSSHSVACHFSAAATHVQTRGDVTSHVEP